MTRLFRLAVVSAISTYLLIILGGITRVSGSGLGCEDDWPLCQDKPYPPLNTLAIIEYAHRTVAAYIGVLVLVTAIMVWRTTGTSARTRWMAVASLALVIVQALLGAVTVWRELPAGVVTAHLGTAMLFFAATLLTAYFVALDRGAPAWLVSAGGEEGVVRDRAFARIAAVGAAVVFLLVLSGGATSTSGAALSCDAWPWCQDSQLVPDRTSRYTWINLSHRATALIGAAAVGIVLWQALRRPVSRAARRLAQAGMGIIIVQIIVGAGYVVTDGSDWLSATHLGIATLLWAAMLGVAVVARRPESAGVPAEMRQAASVRTGPGVAEPVLQMSAVELAAFDGPRGPELAARPHGGGAAVAALSAAIPLPDFGRLRETINEYLALTKPGILTLLLATTIGGMLVAEEGFPSLALILATLLGGALAAGGANALNCYIDRDIDALMGRTRQRGTVTGRISPRSALLFGLSLTTIAILELGLLVNWLAAALALAGNLYYVFVYTKWLKRRTPQNIVIGGAAGAMPPVVGWAAVENHVSLAAVLMFAIIYYWTPPHFWALALLKQGEYGRAAVPMLPVVAGEEETRWQILLYSVMLAAVSLMLVAFGLGYVYLLGALAFNGLFLAMAVRLYRRPSKQYARGLFFYSIWYLALIFGAMVADRLLLA